MVNYACAFSQSEFHLILKFQKFNLDHLGYVFFKSWISSVFKTENPARSKG